MATVKLKFRPSAVKGQAGALYYCVTHKHAVRLINTGYRIHPHEWDGRHAEIKSRGGDQRRTRELAEAHRQVERDLNELQEIIDCFEAGAEEYEAADVVNEFELRYGDGLIAYTRRLVERLNKCRQPVGEKYATTIRKFIAFNGPADVSFEQVTPQLMLEFERWMQLKVTRNTSSFYLRNLHAIYNRAADEGLVPHGANPFAKVYKGVCETRKRALRTSQIRLIKNARLTDPHDAFARDMFMFSFMLCGISFIDMAYLVRGNIDKGYLSYYRKKTAQRITIKWLPAMEEIVRRYSRFCTADHLLPIITETDYMKARSQYRQTCRMVNRRLAMLGASLGLPIRLTTYVARHSWASAAHTSRVPLPVISRCLGHDSEQTTRIYISGLDLSDTDRANETVLRRIAPAD